MSIFIYGSAMLLVLLFLTASIIASRRKVQNSSQKQVYTPTTDEANLHGLN